MEGKSKKKKRSCKRKRNPSSFVTSLFPLADANTIFSLLLAALSNLHSKPNVSVSLIKKCISNLRLSLLSKSQIPNQTLPTPILALLPILLHSKCGAIARGGTEIVGAASLFSLEMNEQIAGDSETVKGLVSALVDSRRRVSMAACNAVLDLSTTSIGRERLLEFAALERLMFKFLQVPISLSLVSLCSGGNGNVTCHRIGFKEDELSVLLLDAAITLINTCDIKQLEKVSRKLSECFLAFLKELWAEVRNKMLVSNTLESRKETDFYLSNIRINNLAESIFRLSINSSQLTTHFPSEVVKRSIFGLNNGTFKNFMLNHWEVSPFLLRRLSSALIEESDIFSSFVQSLNCNGLVSFPSSILQSLVSCLPIASDELDILSFLKEMRHKLGCPLIYEQDIRVIKTEKHSKKAMHFFRERIDNKCSKAPHIFYIDDILKCEEAFKEGYTIALRGVEFRFSSVAAIADGLASLFGQPSIGANIYMTPPNSQGLARHCDDHCVFVCQLFGTKQWTVFSRPNVQLPRLYDALDNFNDVEVESSMAECRHFSLREGDVLYIPRGFPHEACTDNGGPNGSAGFSLHLTLGIEVELPFEWEGFAHVALCCWNETQKENHDTSADLLSGVLNVMSINLLHVVIGLIGDSDPTFRKACLVAAISLPLEMNDGLDLNQENIFRHLIDKISAGSGFLESLRSIEAALQRNEDPFQRMRWLQFLNLKGKTFEGHHWSIPFMGIENIFPLYTQYKDMAEVAFMRVKSKFCSEVLYEDVIENYKRLLEKYKKARKQYMKGMLSLHCN